MVSYVIVVEPALTRTWIHDKIIGFSPGSVHTQQHFRTQILWQTIFLFSLLFSINHVFFKNIYDFHPVRIRALRIIVSSLLTIEWKKINQNGLISGTIYIPNLYYVLKCSKHELHKIIQKETLFRFMQRQTSEK